jgi:deazaflavin-dependent oxidoreductase (nitroreductase family)
MLLLKTIGRKTGKRRFTPVLFKKFHTGEITLYSARGMKADWLKNILADENHQTDIQKGFKRLRVEAKVIELVEDKEEHLQYWFDSFYDAKYIFGYKRNRHGNVTRTEEFKEILELIEFIQLIPVDASS